MPRPDWTMFLLRPAIVGEQRGEVLVVYVSRGRSTLKANS